ncbi:MAG: YicC family protein [Clostridia bacterium]|nr:YicC family protein [Clostridia bacterium]
MNSMTGFGRGEAEIGGHCFTVELKSVNHRYLDMNIRTPRFLMFLEDFIRSEVKKRLARGRVDIFVNYKDTSGSLGTMQVNLEAAKQYVKAAETILAGVMVENDLSITSLMRMEGVITFEEAEKDETVLKEALSAALTQALDNIIAARLTEGKNMAKDLLERKETLAEILAGIEQREPLVVEEYREKLRVKVEEYMAGSGIDENRFNSEILYFSDKASITEEIVRIHSHLKELEQLLNSPEATGRSMDFLVQELNREFNTIGSKASDITITKAVLTAKGEIERIREQIQNME